ASYPIFACQLQYDIEYSRQKLYVLMPVEVCQPNSRAENLLNLRAQLQFDFTKSDFAGRDLLAESDRTNGHLAIAFDQASHDSWRRYRRPLSLTPLRASSQARRLARARDRMLARASLRPPAGAGEWRRVRACGRARTRGAASGNWRAPEFDSRAD